jgi:hypothetical protein
MAAVDARAERRVVWWRDGVDLAEHPADRHPGAGRR